MHATESAVVAEVLAHIGVRMDDHPPRVPDLGNTLGALGRYRGMGDHWLLDCVVAPSVYDRTYSTVGEMLPSKI